MYLGRFFFISFMFAPFLSMLWYINTYQRQLIFLYQSSIICLISCLLVFISLFLVFFLFERMAKTLKRDINQFDIIDREGIVHRMLDDDLLDVDNTSDSQMETAE